MAVRFDVGDKKDSITHCGWNVRRLGAQIKRSFEKVVFYGRNARQILVEHDPIARLILGNAYQNSPQRAQGSHLAVSLRILALERTHVGGFKEIIMSYIYCYLRRLPSLVLILMLCLSFQACSKPDNRIEGKKVASSPTKDTVGKPPIRQSPQKATGQPVLGNPSSPSCVPDDRGRRSNSTAQDKLGDRLVRIWVRESALITREEWRPYMPSGEGTSEFKLVSFEVSNASAAGKLAPNFRCVRMRFLAKSNPAIVRKLLQDGWQLKAVESAETLIGENKIGRLTVSIGLNQDLLTQVDVALLPEAPIPASFPFGGKRPLLEASRRQASNAFEYGIYASGKPGLKFPGLERAIVLIKDDEDAVRHVLEEDEYLLQERGEDLFVKDFETYTFRRYAKDNLALFWQLRMTQAELDPFLIQPARRK